MRRPAVASLERGESQYRGGVFCFPVSFMSEVEYLFLFTPRVSPFCWPLLTSFSMQTRNQLDSTWAALSERELSPSGFLKPSEP